MRLAEELGAQTLGSTADDLAAEILEIARSRNVTAIVIGKPRHGRLREFLYGSVVDKLILNGSGINIYVIQAQKEQAPGGSIATATPGEQVNWSHYGLSLLIVATVTLFSWLLHGGIELVNIALIYQLPVALSAFWWGRWPAYFTAVSSVLIFDFLFVPPIFTFTVYDIRYIWSFLSFLIVAFVIGGRTELLRYEATAARSREKSTRALYDFSREIVAVIDLDTIARKLAGQAADALGRKVIVMLPDANGSLTVWAERDPEAGDMHADTSQNNKFPLTDSAEAAVAAWVYEHRQIAGRSTETLPAAQYLYLPLNTRDSTVGVLGIRIVEKLITHEQRRLMHAWAGLAAIAIERVKLAEEARQAALLAESDRLRSALFNSVSHELRTPLSSIIGSSSTLLEAEDVYSPAEQRALIETVKEGATRINLILLNLLDTARLESGMLQLKYDWCDIEDIIGTALRQLADQIKGRPLDVKIPDDIPLLRGDCVLLVQVMVNLVDNATKYSPRGGGIEIKVGSNSDSLQVSVVDHGAGIPEADLPRVFDKFFRLQRRTGNVPGTGLGLSICKGLVEAHGGKIWAENAAGGGAAISFTLPLGNNPAAVPPESE